MTPEEDEERWRAAEARQWRADWLQELGVPSPFHDAIIDANDKMTSVGGQSLGFAIVVGIPVGVTIAALAWLLLHVNARAVALADQTGASLVYMSSVGIGPVLLLLTSIAFFGVLAHLFDLPALAGRYQVDAFPNRAAALINSPPPGRSFGRRAAHWLLRGSVRRAAARSATAEAFLRAVAVHQVRRWGVGALLFSTPAILVTALETNSFWVAGPSGIAEHRMLAPFSSGHRYDLADTAAVITGCSDMDNRLVYEIHLVSGERFSLGNSRPLKGSKLEALEAIDAKIGRSVEHRRWSHLDRDPAYPPCLRYWAGRFDADGQRRLAALLRLTPHELRRLASQ